MNPLHVLYNSVHFIELGLYLLVAIAAVAGAITAVITRDDAYDVAGCKPKMVWFALLMGSAMALFASLAVPLPILPWVGAVITGIYWFDVRPHLQGLIRGDYRY